MSTRCQILFRFSNGEVLTYRHSDGYPKGVIPDLVAFLKWNGNNSDYTYTMANYFFWNKKRYAKYLRQGRLGFGLNYDGQLCGDINYFYAVDFIESRGTYPNTMRFRIAVYDTEYNVPSTPAELIACSNSIQTVFIKDIKTFRASRAFNDKPKDQEA